MGEYGPYHLASSLVEFGQKLKEVEDRLDWIAYRSKDARTAYLHFVELRRHVRKLLSLTDTFVYYSGDHAREEEAANLDGSVKGSSHTP